MLTLRLPAKLTIAFALLLMLLLTNTLLQAVQIQHLRTAFENGAGYSQGSVPAAVDEDPLQRTLQRASVTLIAFALISLVMAVMLIVLTIRAIVFPLRHIAGSFSHRIADLGDHPQREPLETLASDLRRMLGME